MEGIQSSASSGSKFKEQLVEATFYLDACVGVSEVTMPIQCVGQSVLEVDTKAEIDILGCPNLPPRPDIHIDQGCVSMCHQFLIVLHSW